jgi:hypothetical protein
MSMMFLMPALHGQDAPDLAAVGVRPSIASIFEAAASPVLATPVVKNPSPEKERLCVKSFPHPPERLAIQLTSAEMKKLHDEVQSLLTRWEAADPQLGVEQAQLPLHLQKLYRSLEQGLDVEQARRYANFLLLFSLDRDENYPAVRQSGQRQRIKHSLTISGVPWGVRDQGPFYSSEALETLACLLEYRARAKMIQTATPRETLPLITEFLDEPNSPDGEQMLKENLFFDIQSEVLGCLNDVLLLELDRPLWWRLVDVTPPAVLAAAAHADSVQWLFLRGRQSHVVQAENLGKFVEQDLNKAALWYQELCRRRLAQDKVHNIQRFTIHPPGQSREVEFSPQTFVSISKADQTQLLDGRPLSGEHALSRTVMGTQARELLWLNPFQQYRGSELREVEKLLGGLRLSYPDREFSLDVRPEEKVGERLQRLAELQVDSPSQFTVLNLGSPDPRARLVASRQVLRTMQVEWVDVPASGKIPAVSATSRLVVLLGDGTEETLRSRVRAFGEQKWFAGRVVLLAIESAAPSISLHAEIVGRAEAAGLIQLSGSVGPDTIQELLVDLATKVKGEKGQPLEALIRKVLRDRRLISGWTI